MDSSGNFTQTTDESIRIKELEYTISVLESKNKDYSKLLKIVAHDLKNPISAIFGVAALMLGEERSEEDREMLELLTDSVNSLTRTINDLLVFNLDTEGLALEQQTLDITEIIRHSVALLGFNAREKKQKIFLNASSKCMVAVNRDSIWRVLNNLIVNAIKFSPTGSTITVNAQQKDTSFIVSVTDKGIGIPDHLKPNLLRFSSDSNRSGTLGEESFGLGLHISRQIIEAHKGKIWFESEQNKGTTFYFELPVVK